MSKSALKLPFHATQSEKRILDELKSVAEVRQAHEIVQRALDQSSAAAAIELLARELFPAEARLRGERSARLRQLNQSPLRAHFDYDLESPEITLSAKISTEADFERVRAAINTFDIAAWLNHCEAERSDAD